MKLKHLLFSVIILGTVASCKKPNQNTPAPTVPEVKKEVDVYIAGYTTNANNVTVATIWKNGVQQVLSSISSEATSVAVQGNDVHVVGRSITETGKNVITYWKNGVQKKLTDSLQDSYATGIALSGNDVHVIGNIYSNGYANIPFYWKNGTRQPFSFTGDFATLEAVTANGSDVYIVGQTRLTSAGSAWAVYWKNGVDTKLSSPGTTAYDIFIKKNNVYIVGGRPFPAENMYLPAYWINGYPLSLPDESVVPRASAIAVHDDDIYMAGTIHKNHYNFKTVAVYWKNGKTQRLTDEAINSEVYSMAVNFDDIYVGGESPTDRAVYWKNGLLNVLSDSKSRVYKIILTPRN